MQFPPPKELTFSAWLSGLISDDSYFKLIQKLNEEYEEKEAAKNETYHGNRMA